MKKLLPILILALILGIFAKKPNENIVFVKPEVKGERDGLAINAEPTIPEIEISFKSRKAQAIQLAYDAAKEFGMDPETLLCVLNRESGVESHDPATGKLKCGDNGASCGIGQIKLGTWESIRKTAGWDQEDKRWDDHENVRTTAYGITHGWEEHWTGFRDCRDMGYKIK
jgi:hypothetical protein